MNARPVLFAALALALPNTACQPPAQETGPLSEEDVAAITTASDAWVEAYATNDDAAMLAASTEDLVLMPPDMPMLRGKAAAEEYLASFEGIELTVTRLGIEGGGDVAVEWATYGASAVLEGVPEPISYPGKYVSIWKKQADGQWRIALTIWNPDAPFPGEASAP